MSLVDQVKTNLTYYNLWNETKVIEFKDGLKIIAGVPPEPVHPIPSIITMDPNQDLEGNHVDNNNNNNNDNNNAINNNNEMEVEQSSGVQIPQLPKVEYVYPVGLNEKISLKQVSQIFENLQIALNQRPKRITLGVVANDGTIVYYFVHDGLAKPKKN